MTVSVQFDLPDKEHAALRKKAAGSGIKLAALLRLLVQKYIVGEVDVVVNLKHFDLGGVEE